MSWKRMSITIFLLIVFLNILQINIFLLFVFNSQPSGDSGGGLSSDTIASIWFGELVLGIALILVWAIYFVISKRRKKSSHPTAKRISMKNIALKISSGFNHVSPYYKVEIQNKTSMPVIDVTITPSLSEDSFEFDQEEKKIPLIRSNGSRVMKFGLRPKEGKSGTTIIKGYVKYLNLEIDEYEEMPLSPKEIKIAWPVLSKVKINDEEWDRISKSLISAQREIEDIPFPGKEVTKNLRTIVKTKRMHIVSTISQDNPYSSTIKVYAKDEEDQKYCGKFEVQQSPENQSQSKIILTVFGANKKVLAGYFYIIYNKIETILMKKDKKALETKGTPSLKKTMTPEYSKRLMEGMGIQRDIFNEFDRLRERVETIEKDKIGVDSQFTSLYELDELYKILAEDLVKRRIVDIKAGEEIVKKRLEKKYYDELKRFDEAYALLCEAETSDSVLMRKDFPDSGKKAILLVYFNAIEVYIREKLKELIPKGVTILLGENHGHINTRKKDWERTWNTLGLGSCIHIINRNKYIFLRDEDLWKHKVETMMHQVREMRNTIAHPSTENPDPKLVREKVYRLFTLLPDALKEKN
jgi:hypothetical protein